MNTYQPYTYLIGWSDLDKWYYGVRFAKNCHPSDLWVTYFTSSKHVTLFRKEHGEPDVVQVRRTFVDSKSARGWEYLVLKRMGVINESKWLNKACGKSIDPIIAGCAARNRMLTNNPMKSPEIASKVAKQNSLTNKKRMLAMSPADRSQKFGNHGTDNPFYGRKHSKNLQEEITRKISGNYILTDPNGNVKQINNLYRYCKDHNLNRDILMKHMNGSVVPEPIYKTKSVARHNTTGYTIRRA